MVHGSPSCAPVPVPGRGANSLRVLDVEEGGERVAADPRALLGGAEERLSPEERARRERSREGGAGIVGYATDSAVELASFALSGRLAAELRVGTARELPTPGPVIDPRPSPTAGTSRTSPRAPCGSWAPRATGTGRWRRRTARASGTGRRVRGGRGDVAQPGLLVEPGVGPAAGGAGGRHAGAALVDLRPGPPGRDPQHVPYPAAGTPNADVRLFVVALDGRAPRFSGPGASVSAECTGQRRVRHCFSYRRATSAASCSWRWTPSRGRHGWCTPTKIQFGWISSPGCPAGAPRDSSCGSPTRVGRGCSRWVNDPSPEPSCTCGRCWTSGRRVLVASAGEDAAEAETGEVRRVNELGVERLSQEPGVHSAVRAGA
ncbi:hypothetical protein STENM327S_06114 [Streptomyces tendae]